MQVQLRKVRETESTFLMEKGSVRCIGSFWRSGELVKIEGMVEGKLRLTCDRCGESFEKEVSEPFVLEASDRPVKVDESLDVIECFDGMVDFDEICESEIASIESGYHLCPRCERDGEFETEL
ncbi:MAG: DUF177 domain-containing protein [Epsilonproteobacteria bacterium]|nr:DUF177 domain-containing protein [Campylobacterota bacterium]